MVNNATNINKTKETLNSNGQQFQQYQHSFIDIAGIVDYYCLKFLLFC
jgi:hypothetical protein